MDISYTISMIIPWEFPIPYVTKFPAFFYPFGPTRLKLSSTPLRLDSATAAMALLRAAFHRVLCVAARPRAVAKLPQSLMMVARPGHGLGMGFINGIYVDSNGIYMDSNRIYMVFIWNYMELYGIYMEFIWIYMGFIWIYIWDLYGIYMDLYGCSKPYMLIISSQEWQFTLYRWCQNYRTEPGVQKYSKIPYLCTPPGSDSARSREI